MSEGSLMDCEVIDINNTVVVPVMDGRDVSGGMRSISSLSLEVVRDTVSVKISVRVRIVESRERPRVGSSLERVDDRGASLRGGVLGVSGFSVSGIWHVDGCKRDSDFLSKNSDEESCEN